MTHKVFQIKNQKLVEFKQVGRQKAENNEKMLQNLVEKNISVLFPNLEFLTSEYTISNLRPDSIVFDNDRNSFVIIEYKNVKHKGVVDQGMSYYKLLQEEKAEFVLLYSKLRITGRTYQVDDFNWDETRIIFISPEFTEHQKRASQSVSLPIELYEITKYEDDIITLNKIENKTGITASTKGKTKGKISSVITEYSEEDYLAGKYDTQIPTDKTRALYFKLKNTILDRFANLEPKQKKKYVGFYSKEDGSCVATMEVRKNKIMLTYSTVKKDLLPKSDFIRDVSKIGHWGVGHFQSEIIKEDDLTKALPLIKIVHDFKIR